MAKYKVLMRGGDKVQGDSVEEEGSFIIIKNGKKEIRVPSADVEKIETNDDSAIGMTIAGLTVFALTGFWI